MHRLLFTILLMCAFSEGILPQGSILLVGGGTENYGDWSDQPYRWLVEHAPNRKILVLHYSDTTTWFSGYFPSLSSCTVSNRFINSASQANDSSIYRLILQHDGIFLRGGDQAQYVSKWKGTLAQQAIKEVFKRGGAVGGTSAGEMVLSDVSYISGNSDLGALLRNPSSSITLTDDFLSLWPDILAESHTNERGRLGRLPVFLANYKSSKGRNITGVAVDVNTALAITPDGIGEVMGASAVALLRWSAETNYQIEAGKAFSMQNMKFDQLLPGYKVNLKTGEISFSSTALQFSPKAVSSPDAPVILDGSGSQSDWYASGGSLRKLQSLLAGPADSVGIISSSSSNVSALSVSSALTSWGVNTRLLLIDDAHKNDLSLKSSVQSCNGFVFVGNSPDSLAALLDVQTAIGSAFSSKLKSGRPMLFLSDDVMLSGEMALGGLYSGAYSAYYGTLFQASGLNLIKGMQPVPRLYQNQDNSRSYDYSENRIMGMFWSMAKSQLPYGMLIDAGTYVMITNNKIEAFGLTANSVPVIIFDAKSVSKTDFPVFHRPGKPNALQNAAFTGALMHILRPGDKSTLTFEKENSSSKLNTFSLGQNYPNPFNPVTNIRFSLMEPGMVTLKVYDIMGREVETLLNGYFHAGIHDTRWEAINFSSGIYLVKLEHLSSGQVNSKTVKVSLIK